MKYIFTLLTILLLLSCTVSPKVMHDSDNESCHLETKMRALKIKEELKGGSRADPITLAVASIYTATTTIVSGSIVLVGNTVHWMEKQGKCDDAFILKTYNEYIEPLIKNGGIILDDKNSI